MSYHKARECFDENADIIPPSTEPGMYNISNGLSELARAIENDLVEVKHLLRNILTVVQRIRN